MTSNGERGTPAVRRFAQQRPFYAVFACALLFRKWGSVVAVTVAMIVVAAIVMQSALVLEFLMGMGVVLLSRVWKPAPRTGLVILMLGSALLLAFFGDFGFMAKGGRVIQWGIPATVILFGAVHCVQHRSTMINYLGDASYSIYLVHVLSIPAVLKFLPDGIKSVGGDILAVLTLLASIAAGCVFHSLIEKPVTRYLKGLTGRRPVRQAAAAA